MCLRTYLGRHRNVVVMHHNVMLFHMYTILILKTWDVQRMHRIRSYDNDLVFNQDSASNSYKTSVITFISEGK